jgi:hypothetical protein
LYEPKLHKALLKILVVPEPEESLATRKKLAG